jgi:hypothetical protein
MYRYVRISVYVTEYLNINMYVLYIHRCIYIYVYMIYIYMIYLYLNIYLNVLIGSVKEHSVKDEFLEEYSKQEDPEDFAKDTFFEKYSADTPTKELSMKENDSTEDYLEGDALKGINKY